MEAQRGFLVLALAFLSFLLFQQWQADHAPPPPAVTQAANQSSSRDASLSAEGAHEAAASDIPAEPGQPAVAAAQQLVWVDTDVMRVAIDTRGGDVVRAELKDYPLTTDEDSPPVVLFTNQNNRVYEAQSALVGTGAPDQGQRAVYAAAKSNYQLDGERLVVPLTWQNEAGVTYIKEFEFTPGSHAIAVRYRIHNTSSATLSNRLFLQLKRDRLEVEGPEQAGFGIQAYLGPAYSSDEERYERYDFGDIQEQPLNVVTNTGWIAYLQHYFVTAWVPEQQAQKVISTAMQDGGRYALIRMKLDRFEVAPGQQQTVAATLYAGPKIQSDLEAIHENLDLTVDYGFLWWMGQFLFWVLNLLQSVVINWGVAIILLTVLVKLALWPLAAKQYRSTAAMRELQPRLQQLKERYGDDRQKMQQAMMEMYRKEGANPLGGCLPMLIQFPVFLALYWVLMESVELRHADFFLWINDLSQMDPLFILPVLMGGSMYLMQKMQPMSPSMDPMQQKIMQFFPVVLTVFMLWFPAGLVLYWLVNNLISIAQQVYITKKYERERAAKKRK